LSVLKCLFIIIIIIIYGDLYWPNKLQQLHKMFENLWDSQSQILTEEGESAS